MSYLKTLLFTVIFAFSLCFFSNAYAVSCEVYGGLFSSPFHWEASLRNNLRNFGDNNCDVITFANMIGPNEIKLLFGTIQVGIDEVDYPYHPGSGGSKLTLGGDNRRFTIDATRLPATTCLFEVFIYDNAACDGSSLQSQCAFKVNNLDIIVNDLSQLDLSCYDADTTVHYDTSTCVRLAGAPEGEEVCGEAIWNSGDNSDEIICGDGVQTADEECDDGNTIDGDGCQANCKLPVCGDSVQDSGEECDDGNNNDADACSNTCVSNTDAGGGGSGGSNCGDGVVDSGEACDDGNDDDTDDCSNTCVVSGGGDSGGVTPGDGDDGDDDDDDDDDDGSTPQAPRPLFSENTGEIIQFGSAKTGCSLTQGPIAANGLMWLICLLPSFLFLIKRKY